MYGLYVSAVYKTAMKGYYMYVFYLPPAILYLQLRVPLKRKKNIFFVFWFVIYNKIIERWRFFCCLLMHFNFSGRQKTLTVANALSF